jgi:hypothetical protein
MCQSVPTTLARGARAVRASQARLVAAIRRGRTAPVRKCHSRDVARGGVYVAAGFRSRGRPQVHTR